ncbi:hypothetical protein [Micromonospora sp. NPDC050276]|uniref:hypothetical protein n=1 Tax=Micromonospora sp. NPDC050276 TaxID=3364278 RepID=UPI003791CEEF
MATIRALVPIDEGGAHHTIGEVQRPTTKALALNSAHLARLLADQPYPPPEAQNAAVGPSRESA